MDVQKNTAATSGKSNTTARISSPVSRELSCNTKNKTLCKRYHSSEGYCRRPSKQTLVPDNAAHANVVWQEENGR